MKDRLALILNSLQVSKEEFAGEIGVSANLIYKYLKGETEISPRFKRELYKTYPEINPAWFETGEGEMFKWKKGELNKSSPGSSDSDSKLIISELHKVIKAQSDLIDSLRSQIDDLRRQLNNVKNS